MLDGLRRHNNTAAFPPFRSDALIEREVECLAIDACESRVMRRGDPGTSEEEVSPTVRICLTLDSLLRGDAILDSVLDYQNLGSLQGRRKGRCRQRV